MTFVIWSHGVAVDENRPRAPYGREKRKHNRRNHTNLIFKQHFGISQKIDLKTHFGAFLQNSLNIMLNNVFVFSSWIHEHF